MGGSPPRGVACKLRSRALTLRPVDPCSCVRAGIDRSCSGVGKSAGMGWAALDAPMLGSYMAQIEGHGSGVDGTWLAVAAVDKDDDLARESAGVRLSVDIRQL